MRARMLALRGARVGRRARVGPGCRFEKPWCITLDEACRLEADVYFKISDPDAVVRIGRLAFVGRATELDVSREINIGAQALIAPGCFLTDHSHRFREKGRGINEQGSDVSAVRVGPDAWLGAGVVVLPGVTVGAGAVIGANSVVRASVPDLEIHAGVPARRIGDRR